MATEKGNNIFNNSQKNSEYFKRIKEVAELWQQKQRAENHRVETRMKIIPKKEPVTNETQSDNLSFVQKQAIERDPRLRKGVPNKIVEKNTETVNKITNENAIHCQRKRKLESSPFRLNESDIIKELCSEILKNTTKTGLLELKSYSDRKNSSNIASVPNHVTQASLSSLPQLQIKKEQSTPESSKNKRRRQNDNCDEEEIIFLGEFSLDSKKNIKKLQETKEKPLIDKKEIKETATKEKILEEKSSISSEKVVKETKDKEKSASSLCSVDDDLLGSSSSSSSDSQENLNSLRKYKRRISYLKATHKLKHCIESTVLKCLKKAFSNGYKDEFPLAKLME